MELKAVAGAQLSFNDKPNPGEFDYLREQMNGATDPTEFPNRKWSHTFGESGRLDVWPVSDIAWPEHAHVWGLWGWENCSQGHLWWDATKQKWMIYPWRDRPHCLNGSKPKEAQIKKQFISSSVKDVITYVRNTLHGEPEIATSPMPADTHGQMHYAEQSQKSKYNKNTPEYDIEEVFSTYFANDEHIYWDPRSETVYWYAPEDVEDQLGAAKTRLLEIPEVKTVTFGTAKPQGGWKKIASSQAAKELFSTLKVEWVNADNWSNDKSHIPGIYVIPENKLYMADSPGHHSDIMDQDPMKFLNSIGVDLKQSDLFVIMAPSPETPREYLEVLADWAREYYGHISIQVEYNGDAESRMDFNQYIHRVYEQGMGWEPEPYCEYCGSEGHTDEEHEHELEDEPFFDVQPMKASPSKPPFKFKTQDEYLEYFGYLTNHPEWHNSPVKHLITPTSWQNYKDWLELLKPNSPPDYLVWLEGIGTSEVTKPNIYKKGSQEYYMPPLVKEEPKSAFYWWVYDMDSGEMAIAPSNYTGMGLLSHLKDPDNWVGGRYWSGYNPEIKVDTSNSKHGAVPSEEIQHITTIVASRLAEQEGMGNFFAAHRQIPDETLIAQQAIQNKQDLRSVIPKKHQQTRYFLWYPSERDQLEDKGVKLDPLNLFKSLSDAKAMQQIYPNLDIWELDATGTNLTKEVEDVVFPEQLTLILKAKPKLVRGPQEDEVFDFFYNIENGELYVAPPGKEYGAGEAWGELGNPLKWLSGTYDHSLDRPILTLKKPKTLELDKQQEYEADILKKLQTIPLIKNAMLRKRNGN